MNSPEIAFIRCTVTPGMFPDEYAVEIGADRGETISLFTEKSALEKIDLPNQTAYLRVQLLNNKPEQGEQLVFLPAESLEKGNRWLEVPASELIQL